MKFQKERVYSAVNADELHVGDKVITAQHLGNLKYQVSQKDYYVWTIKEIKKDTYSDRFVTGNGTFPLVYLIERAENCTNCGEGKWDAQHQKILCDPVHCGNGNVIFRNHEIEVCEYWKPKTKQKDEKDCDNCGQRCDGYGKGDVCSQWKSKAEEKNCYNCRLTYTKNGVMRCMMNDQRCYNPEVACYHYEPTTFEKHTDYNHCEEAKKAYVCAMTNACPNKHYRPFKNIDELIKVWEKKWSEKTNGQKWHDCNLNMPHIWVRLKECNKGGLLITYFGEDEVKTDAGFLTMSKLLNAYTFTDGSVCGVEV